MDRRSFQTIKVGEQAFVFDCMIYGGHAGEKQPLLIFHSIEFAMPPSEAFCQIMWDAGLQVIFARRPGYGDTSPLPVAMMTKGPVTSGATAITEAAMLRELIRSVSAQMDTMPKPEVAKRLSDKVSMCNYRANRLVCDAADRAIQTHGGIGYSRHLPFEHIYRHHRRYRITEGAEEIQMRKVAGVLFGYIGSSKIR